MKFSKILTIAALSAVLGFAQGTPTGHGPGNGTPPDPAQRIARRVDALTRLLSLTDAQKQQATTLFTNADAESQSIRTQLRSANDAIAAAVKTNNTAAIDQNAATVGSLNGQLISIESKANAAFYAILTPDQQAKYPVNGPGFGGPGGPGGPGQRGFGGFRRGPNQ